MLCCTSVIAQHNCDLEVNAKSKKAYKKAKSAANSRLYAKANQYLKEAIDDQSDFVDAHFLLARISLEQKNENLAAQNFKKVIEICADYSPEVYWLLANIEFNGGLYKEAEQNFKTYLTFVNLDPKNRTLAQERLKKAIFLNQMYSNPVPFQPTLVQGISTSEDEYLSIFSPDNELALFVRRGVRQEKGMLASSTLEEFVMAKTDSNGIFNKGELMPYPFNLNRNQGSASLTIANNEMYLSICEIVDNYNNCDLFYTFIDKGFWGDLKRLKYPVNTPSSWESQPSISSDGNTLIFTSARMGGVGKTDLYSVQKNENGEWTNLQSLSFNTEGSEKSPFLHPDGKTLYFSSDGLQGLGGYDIFYCKLDSNGEWTTPKNIGFPINSEQDDLGFFVSTDGKNAYFSSNKLEGAGGLDLYSFSLYKEARPERVLMLKGEVLDKEGEPVQNSYLEIKSLKSNKVERVEVNARDGKYVGLVTLDKDEDVLVTVNGKGYAFNSTYINADDRAFESPSDLDFDLSKIEVGKAFKINNIYFSTDSFNLNKKAKIILNSFVEFLQANPSVRIAVHGHTDSDGDQKLNLELSTKRAEQVHNYIKDMGVEAGRLQFKGFGETKPLQSNNSEEGKSANRRTEFFVVGK